MSKWYKQSNALAKSLELPGGSRLFKEVQRFEKKLKEDGSWQKIKNIKKQKGTKEAVSALMDTLDEYRLDPELYPPDLKIKEMPNVYYEGRSVTGGDWYAFGGSHDYYDLTEGGGDSLDEHLFYDGNDEYNNIMNAKFHEILETSLWEKFNGIKDKLEEGLANLERRIEENIHGGQMHFEFHDLENQLVPIQNKYEKRLKKIEELENKITNEALELEWEDDDSDLDEWLQKTFGEEVSEQIKAVMEGNKEEAKDKVKEKYIEKLQDQLWEEIEKEYHKVTCGGHWCISPGSGMLEDYIPQGDAFLVLRRDGEPRIAIRYSPESGYINEVQGVSNSLDYTNALDMIDLLDVPDLSTEEVLDGLMSSENESDPEVLAETLSEILAGMEDEEMTAPMFREITSSGSTLIEMMFPSDKYLENLIVEDDTNWGDKLKNALLLGLKEDKDSLATGKTNVRLNHINGWFAFGLGILEEHGYHPHIIEALKTFFGGEEYELLDEFVSDIAQAPDRGEIIRGVIPQIRLLLGNKWADYINEYIKEQSLTEEAGDDSLRSGMWPEGSLTPENFSQVMNMVFADINYDYILPKNIFLINQLWEKGKSVFPNNVYPLAIDFCTLLLKGYERRTKSPHADDVQLAMMLLYYVTNELREKGLSPELLGILKDFNEVQSAYRLVMEKGNMGTAAHYRHHMGKLPESELVPSNVVHGLPLSGPSIDDSVSPVVNPVQSKRKGWYKN